MTQKQALEKITAFEKELPEIKKALEQSIEPEKQKISAEEYLTDILKQCTGKVIDGYITWYIGEQWIFQQDLKNKYLWCYYHKVWQIFEDQYSMNYQQIQVLQKELVAKPLGCEGFTP